MKKLFFIAAVGVAGMMSAKSEIVNKVGQKNSDESKKEVKIFQASNELPSMWIKCVAPCGAVYWMQLSVYDSMDDFWDANAYFNDVKC